MKGGFGIVCCSTICFVLCTTQGLLAQAAGNSFQDSTNELSVTVGKTVLVDTAQPIQRISIGLGGVADATAVSPTEVMVNGKAPGETSLIIWDIRGGRQFFNVAVRPSMAATEDSMEALRRELRSELPGQVVRVSTDGKNVFLRGTVKDLTSSQRAVEIASTAGKVVNLLNVVVPTSKPQILLKVRFASFDRSKALQLGLNLAALGMANTYGSISTGQFAPPTVTNVPGQSVIPGLNILALNPGNEPFAFDLQALVTEGVVQVLAQPNLLAMDGKEASFLAGGEYPYPVVQGVGFGSVGAAVTIMFKEYGIRLNFIPTVTPRDTIRLQVAPEVSALDFTNAVTISGFTVPAITVRNVNTEVELKDGQSFIIGGLLNNEESQTFEKIPFLGDIPILGKFFQSIQKNQSNTELIVIVTPEIVAPIPSGAPLPQLNYSQKFLPRASNFPMHTPDAKTSENTLAPAPTTIPIEKLIESMKPEQQLQIQSGGGGGYGSGGGTGMSSGGGGGASASTGP
jgi:pilus assembly protein CpaC